MTSAITLNTRAAPVRMFTMSDEALDHAATSCWPHRPAVNSGEGPTPTDGHGSTRQSRPEHRDGDGIR